MSSSPFLESGSKLIALDLCWLFLRILSSGGLDFRILPSLSLEGFISDFSSSYIIVSFWIAVTTSTPFCSHEEMLIRYSSNRSFDSKVS